ncbi:hypothetical protein EDD18DRAFT_340441 [Armillaria luteobubalina]|uniref:Uncharacterized protein n=1 Tax=Armillaria luteobubalina TaxID=153913 RepID=A0AA39QPB3_9AGAR|nr:hypothetical protein EDD18DRAFT_340441 [Armillaria luteobubalina]
MAGFHDFTRRAGGIRHLRRSEDNCSTGGFYISPAKGAVVDSLTSTNITWDPSYLEANAVDIHLYAPSMSNPKIYVWEEVKNADGTYEATLEPRWWNSSSTIQLQLVILPSGNPPFLATLPAGPLWNATYTQPESGTPDSADTSKQGPAGEVVGSASDSKAISAGQLAAAVVTPVIFIILCMAAWLVWRRRKGLKERKAWTEAVDRRMSTTSDWPSITVAGASAAIRNSLAWDTYSNEHGKPAKFKFLCRFRERRSWGCASSSKRTTCCIAVIFESRWFNSCRYGRVEVIEH